MARTHPSKPNSIQLWNIYIIHIRLKVYKEMEKNVNPLFEVELNETGWDIVDGRRIPQHKLKVYPLGNTNHKQWEAAVVPLHTGRDEDDETQCFKSQELKSFE